MQIIWYRNASNKRPGAYWFLGLEGGRLFGDGRLFEGERLFQKSILTKVKNIFRLNDILYLA